MTGRARTVTATDAMMVFPIWVWVSPRSSLTIAISGVTANHPKKLTKNDIHEMWNTLI